MGRSVRLGTTCPSPCAATSDGTTTAPTCPSRRRARCSRRRSSRTRAAIPASPTCAPRYDALDDATRERIDGLAAYHSRRYSMDRADLHVSEENADRYQLYGYGIDIEPPLRPLVKVHPATGRPEPSDRTARPRDCRPHGRRVRDTARSAQRRGVHGSAHLLPLVDEGGCGAVGQPVPHAPGDAPRSRTGPTDVAHPDRRRPGDRIRSRPLTIRPPTGVTSPPATAPPLRGVEHGRRPRRRDELRSSPTDPRSTDPSIARGRRWPCAPPGIPATVTVPGVPFEGGLPHRMPNREQVRRSRRAQHPSLHPASAHRRS